MDRRTEHLPPQERQHSGMRKAVALSILLAALPLAARADDASSQPVAPAYRLSGTDSSAAAGRLGSGSLSTPEFFYRLPSDFTFDSLTGVNPDFMGTPTDRTRATMRYTWMASPGWAMKVGMSTMLEPDTTWQRMMLAAADRPRVANMPSMHLAGQGQLSDRWTLSLDAEGQRWARGQSLDMDLRLDYHLTPGLALFGSYRLTDNFGDAAGDAMGFPVSSSARFGVRLRF